MSQAKQGQDVQKISINEVKDLMEKGREVTVVDSRSTDAWGESNVKAKGAVRIPPDDIERHIEGVAPKEFVVVYCT
jgi:rhodanese-related sulfurtransferase